MPQERVLYCCPCCGKLSSASAFKTGEAGGHPLEARVVAFVGGGRAGRPKEVARDDDGAVRRGPDGKPLMVLQRDEDGKPAKGRGFQWSARDLTTTERADVVRILRTVAARLLDELIEDMLDEAHVDDVDGLADTFARDVEGEAAARLQLIEDVRQRRYESD